MYVRVCGCVVGREACYSINRVGVELKKKRGWACCVVVVVVMIVGWDADAHAVCEACDENRSKSRKGRKGKEPCHLHCMLPKQAKKEKKISGRGGVNVRHVEEVGRGGYECGGVICCQLRGVTLDGGRGREKTVLEVGLFEVKGRTTPIKYVCICICV